MDVMHQIFEDGTRVAVGHHMGIRAYLDDHLSPAEKEITEPLSPRKKKEWMASRELLHIVSGQGERMECIYDDFGKPILKGSERHVSISHSELWCAAIISDRHCGVDIQTYSDTVGRISSRFLSAEELGHLSRSKKRGHDLHILWGAKECIYKAYGKKKLGFRENIRITRINPESCTAKGEIGYEGLHLQYDIRYRMLPEVAWVFCLERRPATSLPLHEL